MKLHVQTDWDFALRFEGVDYTDYEFDIELTVEQLDEVEVLGPFGRPGPPAKAWEWYEAVKRIKADPTESFNTTGGNRGVVYYGS